MGDETKDNVTKLSCERATRCGDCRHMTIEDALEMLLADIKSGEVKPEIVFVAMRERDREDPSYVDYSYACAGGNTMEMAGLLAHHLHRICMPS